jgi:uncharacterized protein (DUF433 family)
MKVQGDRDGTQITGAWSGVIKGPRSDSPIVNGGHWAGYEMSTREKYRHLERRADKRTQELFIAGTGIRSSTVWNDRYVSRLRPDEIAKDRDIRLEAVYEALEYCRDNWEIIWTEKDREREHLGRIGFHDERPLGP